jgi:hypothetical protein
MINIQVQPDYKWVLEIEDQDVINTWDYNFKPRKIK